MDRNNAQESERVDLGAGRVYRLGAIAGLLAAALVSPCHADSALRSASGGSGAISGSAHLDFRITVLPSLSLSAQGAGYRVQGNSGVLTLQHSRVGAEDGRAPANSAQLSPRRQVVDTALRTASPDTGDLVTVASP